MYLKQNITSYVNPSKIYGKKGEQVKIISHKDGLAIVEGESERFTCRTEHLSQSFVAKEELVVPQKTKKKK